MDGKKRDGLDARVGSSGGARKGRGNSAEVTDVDRRMAEKMAAEVTEPDAVKGRRGRVTREAPDPDATEIRGDLAELSPAEVDALVKRGSTPAARKVAGRTTKEDRTRVRPLGRETAEKIDEMVRPKAPVEMFKTKRDGAGLRDDGSGVSKSAVKAAGWVMGELVGQGETEMGRLPAEVGKGKGGAVEMDLQVALGILRTHYGTLESTFVGPGNARAQELLDAVAGDEVGLKRLRLAAEAVADKAPMDERTARDVLNDSRVTGKGHFYPTGQACRLVEAAIKSGKVDELVNRAELAVVEADKVFAAKAREDRSVEVARVVLQLSGKGGLDEVRVEGPAGAEAAQLLAQAAMKGKGALQALRKECEERVARAEAPSKGLDAVVDAGKVAAGVAQAAKQGKVVQRQADPNTFDEIRIKQVLHAVADDQRRGKARKSRASIKPAAKGARASAEKQPKAKQADERIRRFKEGQGRGGGDRER